MAGMAEKNLGAAAVFLLFSIPNRRLGKLPATPEIISEMELETHPTGLVFSQNPLRLIGPVS